MDLQILVQKELDTIASNGTIEKIVAAQLEATIKSILKDSMREYSDFGKKIKDKINEALCIDLSNVSMVQYSAVVSAIIKEQLDKSLFATVNEPIARAVKEYTGLLEKTEWKLSEIIEAFKESIEIDDRKSSMTLDVKKSSYNYTHISFDKDFRKKEYDCAYNLSLDKEGKLYAFRAGQYVPHRGEIRQKPIFGRFDGFIFKMYAMGCSVIVDEDDCNTEWYSH